MDVRTVFMGSPDFAVPILERLAPDYPIIGVVTQPNRPAGRGKILTSPPVKIVAESLGIPVIQPEKLKEPFAKEQLIAWAPDLIVVAAFGQILRKWALDLPRYGCINVHGSLLPRWRGASPIQAAILHGDKQTGISIMKMDEGIDTGDVLSMESLEIDSKDTTESLSQRLALVGADLLERTLPDYLSGKLLPKPQSEDGASYAGMITPSDALLDFSVSSGELERRVRAYQPWPVAKMNYLGQTISIFGASCVQMSGTVPGKRYLHKKFPAVGTNDGYLVLEVIQPAGKKKMSGTDFINGNKNWAE